jgi:hypothetical protein
MKFYPKSEKTQWFQDEWDMVVRRPHPREKEPNIGNRGDSIINTSLCAIAYDSYGVFIRGLIGCIRFRDVEVWRHPLFNRNNYEYDTTRDQYTMMIVAGVIRKTNYLTYLLENIKWRISDKHKQTPDFWLWQKSIKHNSKWIAALHHIGCIIWLFFAGLYEKYLRGYYGIQELDQVRYRYLDHYKPSDEEVKKYKKRSVLPGYALHLFSWQYYVMPKVKLLSWIMRKVALMAAPKYAYMVRMLLGAKVAYEDIESYEPMIGRPFAGLWNISRTKFSDYEHNNIDYDLLWKVYEMTQKK